MSIDYQFVKVLVILFIGIITMYEINNYY